MEKIDYRSLFNGFEIDSFWNESNLDGLKAIIEFVEEELGSELLESPSDEPKKIIDPNMDIRRNPREWDYSKDGIIRGRKSYIVTVKGAYDENHNLPELIYKQGNAYEDFQGTCGLCSTGNSARLLRISSPTEKDVIDYACENGLCVYQDGLIYGNGGTTDSDRVEIGIHYGMDPQLDNKINFDTWRRGLEEGCAITFTVYGEWLRSDVPDRLSRKVTVNHCISCIEMVYDNETDELLGIYVQDTGGWIENDSGIAFIPIKKLKKMLLASDYSTNIRNYRKERND